MRTQGSGALLTSEAGSVRGIHGNHRLRDTRWTAESCAVQGPHPEYVGAPLHQARDRETGVLDRDIVALSPVVSAHLTPAKESHGNKKLEIQCKAPILCRL